MEFKAKFFDGLTTHELYEIVRARTQIFLLEQRIICQDFDGVDYDSLHCFLEEEGKILAYLRAYPTETHGVVKLGRILSVTHRIGLGTRLLREAIPMIQKTMNCQTITLHAQKHAQGFYEKHAQGFYERLGFVANSPDFLEENIPHVSMILEQQSTKEKA